jgi:uncharacterized protein
MMFRRRTPLSLQQRLSRMVMPPTGWRRYFRYWGQRTLRLPGTPSTIAKGFAWGAAVSFTPLLGFHLVLAFLGTWICRANFVAAAIGTLVGNPFTLLPIFTLLYQTGKKILGRQEQSPVLFKTLFEKITNPVSFIETLPQFFDPFLKPLLLGSVLWVPIVWVMCYYPCRHLVHRYQRQRYQKIYGAKRS